IEAVGSVSFPRSRADSGAQGCHLPNTAALFFWVARLHRHKLRVIEGAAARSKVGRPRHRLCTLGALRSTAPNSTRLQHGFSKASASSAFWAAGLYRAHVAAFA